MSDAARAPLVIATSADDGYAMPLAVMVRSLVANLGGDEQLRLFVLDGGIRSRTRERLLASWPLERLSVEWVAPDVSRLHDVKVSGHVGLPTYFASFSAARLRRRRFARTTATPTW